MKGGTVIEVSLYLDGLHAIADAVQQHLGVPPHRLHYALPSRVTPVR